MVTKELILYIKKCRKMDFPDWRIREVLREKGWPENEVKKAMAQSFFSKRFSTPFFIITVIILVTVVGLTAWGAIFMLKDIHQTSVDIAEMTKDKPKIIKPTPVPSEEFCGWATEGECSDDSDCMTGGCSGQVCQSKNEEPVITTCEYNECYNAQTFGVSCKCVNNKCQWTE